MAVDEELEKQTPEERIATLNKLAKEKEAEQKRIEKLLKDSKEQARKQKDDEELETLLKNQAAKEVPEQVEQLEEQLEQVDVPQTGPPPPSADYQGQKPGQGYESAQDTYDHIREGGVDAMWGDGKTDEAIEEQRMYRAKKRKDEDKKDNMGQAGFDPRSELVSDFYGNDRKYDG